MKNSIPPVLCALICFACNAAAQGTIVFRTHLDGSQALPSDSGSARSANGLFELQANQRFQGLVDTFGWNYRLVSVYRSTDPNELGDRVFNLTINLARNTRIPPPHHYDLLPRQLTAAQAQDLQAGHWWVVAKIGRAHV